MIKQLITIPSLLLSLSLSFNTTTNNNNPTIDSDAQLVYLRETCLITENTYMDNCFDNTADLTDWLWESGERTQLPSKTERVYIDMGPGDFDPFESNGSLSDSVRRGWVSIKGAGSEVSRFGGVMGLNGARKAAIDIRHCDGLEFDNLGAYGPIGASWAGAGTGKWNQVILERHT